ncbi:MAG: DUF222 domain-containing protein [Trebonia sp.]
MIEQKAESMSTEAIPGSGDYDAGRYGRVPLASAVVLGFPLGLGLDDLGEGGTAGAMAPNAELAALADLACDPAILPGLSDDQLLGVVSAGRRLAARAAWVQQAAIAEFASRRLEPDRKKSTPLGFTAFSPDELVPELIVTGNCAELRMAQSREAVIRLPGSTALLRDGRISEYQMKIIIEATGCLSDEDAAEADRLLAAAAPGLTPSRLRAMCTRIVMMIDPKAAEERKKAAAKEARVIRWQEDSGNAALSGRELPPEEVLAASQHMDATARALRAGGLPGTLQQLRVRVYLDLAQGLDPLDRLRDRLPADDDRLADEGQPEPGVPGGGADPGDDTGARPGRAPVKAVINLLVPVGTLLGWSSAPGEISGFGLLGPQTTRDLVEAAARHPETRWCATIIGADGTAAAHGCAPGQHPWQPSRDPWHPSQPRPPGPGHQNPNPNPSPAEQSAQVTEFLRRLRVEPSRIARGECDHRNYSGKYVISRKVKHLIQARASTCTAPGCNRPAAEADADHTIPWPNGPSCECNLGAPCRYHHRNKQAPGWHLDQPEPGVFRWRNPSGRTHTSYPTRYIT